ncbi:hypothetical protein ACFPIJ_40415 [Dactylosporangium cerinum]|uniref:DUF3592 domain-containing protein n=1 Tax=Dactylosporangium cerinum TaxID=1434730 RepID=A0ABV9W7U9_9ACTN
MGEAAAPPASAPVRQRRGWLAGIAGALTLGALGAGMAGWLAWHTAPDLPDNQTVLEIAQPLVPGATLTVDRRHEPPFGYDPPYDGQRARFYGSDDYYGGYVSVRVEPSPQDLTGAVRTARRALAADGWTVHTREPHLPGMDEGVAAVKGDLVLQVYPGDGNLLTLEVDRRQPWPVGPLVALGGLAGLALGWVGMRRLVARAPLAAGFAGAGILVLAPCTLITVPIVAVMYLAPDTETVASWDIYTAMIFRPLGNIGFALLIVAAVVACFERRRTTTTVS